MEARSPRTGRSAPHRPPAPARRLQRPGTRTRVRSTAAVIASVVVAAWLHLFCWAAAGSCAETDAPAFEDPFATGDPFGIETTDWDSVFAAVDDEFARAEPWLTPLVDLSYDKVAGLHLDGGAGVGPFWSQTVRVEGRAGYDFGREKPTGQAAIRAGNLEDDSLWFEVDARSGIVAFGSHQPYANTLLAYLGGYDARGYVREERGHVGLSWKPDRSWTVRLTAMRVHQAPSPLTADDHLFGSDRWMRENPAADRWTGTGLGLALEHRPRYSEKVALPGTYLDARVESFGGALSPGREFSLWSLRARQLWHLRQRDEFYLAGEFAVTAGDAPRQHWQDLGGHGGLRAFVPRFATGTQRAFVRGQYVWGEDLLRRTRIPWIAKARLHPVPFVETGAVWGRAPLEDPASVSAPERGEVRWDLGIGLRRGVESSGLLSYVQVDVAWPMGSDTGPPRITVTLSSRGFD